MAQVENKMLICTQAPGVWVTLLQGKVMTNWALTMNVEKCMNSISAQLIKQVWDIFPVSSE